MTVGKKKQKSLDNFQTLLSMPSLRLLLERYEHRYVQCSGPCPQFAISFCRSSFEYSGVQLNMDQGDLIKNWTVKFVVCCIVCKQVEVSTILASVESTGQ